MSERHLAIQILKTFHTVEDRLEAAVEPLGLSLAKLGVLDQLVTAGEPLPLRTLADRCACVRSNITQLVDRLEADKLVLRADDPRDRRSVRAELTPEGRSKHRSGMNALRQAERDLVSPLSAKQQNDLHALLEVLEKAD